MAVNRGPELAQFYSEKDDDGRVYKHPLTGEKLPSITTVLKMADKAGLSQWAADQAMSWAVANHHLLGSRSDEDAFRGGRYQWKKFRDERAQVGTGVHEAIEAEHTGSWDYPQLDDEQLRIMEQWRALNEEHEIVPVLSEFTVWFPGKYAGTADGLWYIDGVLTLVDVKTSKNHWPEHDAQLSALANAPILMSKDMAGVWSELRMPKFDRVAIIHLREDKRQIIEINNLDLHFKAFMGYHEVFTAKQALKEREKNRDPGF